MKLQLISDIHLEFGDLELPGGEVLIVAGDMFEVRSLFRNDGGQARAIAKRLWRFLNEEFKKYEDVIYVPGNHEYYGRSIEEAHTLLEMHLPTKVSLLQNSTLTMRGHHIHGCTLWTDMNRDSPQTHLVLRHSMNDFRCIDGFSTHRAFVLHHNYRSVLEQMLDVATHPVIVVTHHAPTYASVPEEYKDDIYLNGGYASDLSELILANPKIKLWCHGHMHKGSDYMVGETRVVCHPRGYLGYEPLAKDYVPKEIVL